jgi:hypothetical protein
VLVALEAALFESVVGTVLTLSFTVTVALHWETVSVGTGPLGFWITTAVFLVVVLVALVAAHFVIFVRFISTSWLSIAEITLHDATILTLL